MDIVGCSDVWLNVSATNTDANVFIGWLVTAVNLADAS